MRTTTAFRLLPLLGFTLAGCAPMELNGPPWAAPPPPPAEFTVFPCAAQIDEDGEGLPSSAAGGTIRAGNQRLVVPGNAVAAAARIQMRRHAAEYLVVSLRPPTQRFQVPVSLVLSTVDCPAPGPPAGAIRYSRQTGWNRVHRDSVSVRPLGAQGGHEVTILTDRFSSYALIAP